MQIFAFVLINVGYLFYVYTRQISGVTIRGGQAVDCFSTHF